MRRRELGGDRGERKRTDRRGGEGRKKGDRENLERRNKESRESKI